MPAKEEFVEANGCKVRLQRAGKGPKILFLHGANGPAIWVPFFDKLAERYEVIAPDHPTYGKSGDPEWLEDIGDLAFFYLDFLKALDFDDVHLLGHSMGGWLAMEIAIRNTSRLASMTVVSPAGIRVTGHPPADIFKLTPAEMMPRVYAGEALRQKMLDMASQPKSEAELDELIRTRTASARLCWHPRLYNPKLARWLHRIDVPSPDRVGRFRRADPARPWARAGQAHPGREPGDHRPVRPRPPGREAAGASRRHRQLRAGARRMKLFMFHLMPYADIDLEEAKKYRSVWVEFPNTNYDPKKGHKLYNRYLDELELAAALGFDGVAVNEHHQNAYGLMPSPIVTASALSRRVEDAKIAILGSGFGLRENPLLLAEEHAMIDNITGGRLISGFVRGIGAEYFSMGVNPVTSHARCNEAHDLVKRAWTEPGPFAWEGHFYNFEYVNVWPRPYQQPHPPIWCPSIGSTETMEWAAHPDRRYVYLQAYTPEAVVTRYLNGYRACCEDKYGYTASSQQLGWNAPMYIADTDEQAVEEARPHIDALFNTFLRMPPEMLLPPGYVSQRVAQAVHADQGRVDGQGHGRVSDRPGHLHLRQPRHGAQQADGPPQGAGLPEPGLHAAVRHAAGRPHRAQHPPVRVGGAARHAAADRQGIWRVRAPGRARAVALNRDRARLTKGRT